MTTLGEPLVHRFVVGKETLIYNHEQGEYFFLYGTYEGNELVIRLTDQIVSEVKLEKNWQWMRIFCSGNVQQSRYKKKRKVIV